VVVALKLNFISGWKDKMILGTGAGTKNFLLGCLKIVCCVLRVLKYF